MSVYTVCIYTVCIYIYTLYIWYIMLIYFINKYLHKNVCKKCILMDGRMEYFINNYLHKNIFIYLFKFVIYTYNVVNVILNISKKIFRILIYSFIQLGCNNIINQKLGYQQKELMPEEL